LACLMPIYVSGRLDTKVNAFTLEAKNLGRERNTLC
jgi:hypothetical protein